MTRTPSSQTQKKTHVYQGRIRKSRFPAPQQFTVLWGLDGVPSPHERPKIAISILMPYKEITISNALTIFWIFGSGWGPPKGGPQLQFPYLGHTRKSRLPAPQQFSGYWGLDGAPHTSGPKLQFPH